MQPKKTMKKPKPNPTFRQLLRSVIKAQTAEELIGLREDTELLPEDRRLCVLLAIRLKLEELRKQPVHIVKGPLILSRKGIKRLFGNHHQRSDITNPDYDAAAYFKPTAKELKHEAKKKGLTQ